MRHKWIIDAERSKRAVAYYWCRQCGSRLISSEAACIVTYPDGSSEVFCTKQNECRGSE